MAQYFQGMKVDALYFAAVAACVKCAKRPD
jgi:hypothetical protein